MHVEAFVRKLAMQMRRSKLREPPGSDTLVFEAYQEGIESHVELSVCLLLECMEVTLQRHISNSRNSR